MTTWPEIEVVERDGVLLLRTWVVGVGEFSCSACRDRASGYDLRRALKRAVLERTGLVHPEDLLSVH